MIADTPPEPDVIHLDGRPFRLGALYAPAGRPMDPEPRRLLAVGLGATGRMVRVEPPLGTALVDEGFFAEWAGVEHGSARRRPHVTDDTQLGSSPT